MSFYARAQVAAVVRGVPPTSALNRENKQQIKLPRAVLCWEGKRDDGRDKGETK